MALVLKRHEFQGELLLDLISQGAVGTIQPSQSSSRCTSRVGTHIMTGRLSPPATNGSLQFIHTRPSAGVGGRLAEHSL